MNIKDKLIRYLFNMKVYFLSQLRNRNKLTEASRIVYFDVHSSFGRNLYPLLLFFQKAGYKIYLKHRIGFIASLNSVGSYSQSILQIPNLTFCLREPKKYQVKFVDTAQVKHEQSTIYLDDDYFQLENSDTFHMPMLMHPLMYKNGYYYQSEEYSKNPSRNIKIFFAGNLDEKLYSQDILSRVFGKLSRYDIYHILLKQFKTTTFLIAPPDRPEFILEDHRDKIICVDSKKSFSIPSENFLETLSKCDFFLSLPGVVMPLCHNTIEAMSVGAIPILQHPELFYPQLEHGVNCLVFQDKEDVIIKVKEALFMDRQTVECMRNNVIDYYHKNLVPKALVNKIEARLKNLNRVYINNGHNSVKSLEARLPIQS